MSCVISKANIQLYFVNVPVQRRKAVIAMQCPLIESKHKADVFHFSLYLHPFIGSNHKNGVPLPFLSLPSPFYTLQRTDNKSFMRNVKSDSKWKTKRSSSRVNIKTASWWDVLDSWMCWIFGCVGWVGYNRVRDKRQGFEGEGLRIGYKPADRSHPKIKQKKESLEDFSSKLSL